MHEDTIVEVLDKYAGLAKPAAEMERTADLYEAGMTSHASVSVMLALEEEFDIEFPNELLKRDTFKSIQTIADAVAGLEEDDA